MKKITVDIQAYIKSVVALEDKIKFAKSPAISIPKDMKYPESRVWKQAPLKAFVSGILP